MNQAALKILVSIVIILAAVSSCCAVENSYTFKNNSDVEIQLSAWFTNSVKGFPKPIEAELSSTVFTRSSQALPIPDIQLLLQPQESETISHKTGQIQEGECLVYVLAEFRVIPSVAFTLERSQAIPSDLYLVGKKVWMQKLPGLCGINVLAINYDPSTYLKFTININGVDDYLRDIG